MIIIHVINGVVYFICIINNNILFLTASRERYDFIDIWLTYYQDILNKWPANTYLFAACELHVTRPPRDRVKKHLYFLNCTGRSE